MKLKSLQIGHIKDYKGFRSAFIKDLYLEEVDIDFLGILNDNIADTKHHGGKNKALFANSYHNYGLWENFLGKKLACGMMGENLTLENLHEQNVCIGDIHRFENAILQVSEPRKPCVKISKVHQNPNFTQEIFKTGLSGWYYRVLEGKKIHAHSKIELIEKNPINLSVLELNHLFYNPHQALKQNPSLLEKLSKLDTLISQNWHESIQKRLKNTYDSDYMQNL
ncbi:MOSC domain-containing protein [Campylobacter coli]|nr:MOSC domain-containing protein [Campylobacter coli]MCE7216957.1 MOSC domain-containing protein [Campylobacter coli]TXE80816.1 MOSC domain-containing protein [Campylobacter coli]